MRKALSFFQRALDKDPTFARAWTGIAKVWFWLCDAYVKPLDAWPAVKEAALKAIALDDRDAEAYAYVAEANRLLDWDFAGADAELRRALQLDPNFAFGHLMLLHFNALQGQLEEALRQGMEGKQLDPLSPAISTVVSGFYLDTGRLDEALAEAERTQMLDPDYLYPSFAYGPAVAYREKGMFDKAIALYSKAQQTTQLPSSGLAITYVRMGRQVEARHILNQLIEKARTRYIAADSIAAVYVALGEKDEAFRWLERAYAEHSWGVPNIAVSHEFRPLRSDPRYADLLRRTGLDPAKALGRRLAEKVLGTAENKSPAPPIDNKSIAVLPFANLSSEPDTAYFADGIQEEILTRLAKIADLKVISRTSTQRFKTAPKDLPEIAKQLGVANILEGTIQKAEGQVRVNVQLINARNDSHLWAEKYDRKLTDVFGVESEIAKAIADSLEATLTGREIREMNTGGTNNPKAYDAYLHARAFYSRQGAESVDKMIQFCRQAVELDPKYAQAWSTLAIGESRKYFNYETTETRLQQARNAAQTTFRLAPDSADSHQANGIFYYYCLQDFDRALAELTVAHERAPNDVRILLAIGLVHRRQGKLNDSINLQRQSANLDPLNEDIWVNLGRTYRGIRNFDAARALFDRALAIAPNNESILAQKAETYWAQGDLDTAWRLVSAFKFPPGSVSNAIPVYRLYLNLLINRRRFDDAISLISSTLYSEKNLPPNMVALAHSTLGELHLMKGDLGQSQPLFLQAEQDLKTLREQGDKGLLLADTLIQVEARLGRRDEVQREADALLKRTGKDSWRFPVSKQVVARAYAILGDMDRAIPLLNDALSASCQEALTPAILQLDPFLDQLRSDPRFEQLVEGATQPVAPEPAAESTPGKSIAVLPFVDLSQTRDQEYLCDGIQEEILNRLSKIAGLKVISRTSTQRYKSAREKLPAMARQLGAAHILEGTVQRADDQVRIHVQLIDARNDSHLWAEKYDRKLTDVFGVESEIAKAIADALGAKLSGLEQRAIATRPTENAAAHQLYLKGTYFSNKRTGADLRTAIEYFKAAIGNDSKYAAAYAGLADAYTLLSLWGGEGPADTMPQAKAAARKAIELDETLPEAHNSLGLVLALHDFDFAQSQKEFERAIELNPNYATAHHQFGNVNLAMIGEFDRAIAEGNRAVELDPLSLIINADLGQDFMLARRYDEAIEQLRKTLAMDPRFYYARWTLGECLQMKGQLTEAMAEYQKAAEITDDPMVMALLAQGYAKMGQRDKALGLLSQLEQLAKHRYVGPFTFALVHLALDETEKAIDDLERAHRERAIPRSSVSKSSRCLIPCAAIHDSSVCSERSLAMPRTSHALIEY